MLTHPRTQAEHAHELRLWLRLLRCTHTIEADVRSRLRSEFSTTLPRFDLMAQLERHPEGLQMNELSRRLMVSNGNVTGIADQLVREGLVARVQPPNDRRAWLLHLTPMGLERFKAMARAHEGWIVNALSALTPPQAQALFALLGELQPRSAAALPMKNAP